jgi:hypothetical protein
MKSGCDHSGIQDFVLQPDGAAVHRFLPKMIPLAAVRVRLN